jgi:hypothetical protein
LSGTSPETFSDFLTTVIWNDGSVAVVLEPNQTLAERLDKHIPKTLPETGLPWAAWLAKDLKFP